MASNRARAEKRMTDLRTRLAALAALEQISEVKESGVRIQSFTHIEYANMCKLCCSVGVLQLNEWVFDKRAAAEDETYRGAKDIRQKYNRHMAFESEIAHNRCVRALSCER